MRIMLYFVMSFLCIVGEVFEIIDVDEKVEFYSQNLIYSIEENSNDSTDIYATVIVPNDIIKITSLNGRNIKEVYGYDFAQGYIEIKVVVKNVNNKTIYENNIEKPIVYSNIISKYKIAECNLSENDSVIINGRFKLLTKCDGQENTIYYDWSQYTYKDNSVTVGNINNDYIRIKNSWLSYSEYEYTDGSYPVFMFDVEYSKEFKLLLQKLLNSNCNSIILAEYCIKDNSVNNKWINAFAANSRNPYICNNRIIMIEPDIIPEFGNIQIRLKIQYFDDKNNIVFDGDWCYIDYSIE